ncbi:hypothetical protein A2U01_0092244, partial [Trifolium medium]|nr:hypothetical protein [Trifolium medium]
ALKSRYGGVRMRLACQDVGHSWGRDNNGCDRNFVEVIAGELRSKWWWHTGEKTCGGRESRHTLVAGTVHPFRKRY